MVSPSRGRAAFALYFSHVWPALCASERFQQLQEEAVQLRGGRLIAGRET